MIEEARRMSPCPARTQMLVDAVKLLRAGVQKINLPMICQLLYEGNKQYAHFTSFTLTDRVSHLVLLLHCCDCPTFGNFLAN